MISSTGTDIEEQPAPLAKKPSLGKLRLAKPLVGYAHSAAQNADSEPSIEANQDLPGGALPTLTASSNSPVAPPPLGGDVKPAKVIRSVAPVYPAAAKAQHIAGNVKIDALIDASGNVASAKILSGPSELHMAALQAVKQWKYQPAQLDGNPTPMHLTVTVQFSIQ